MHEVTHFGAIVLVVSGVFAVALLSNKFTDVFPIPTPAIFLIGAAGLAKAFPGVAHRLSIHDVERIAVVALVFILFDGGLRVGWRRFRVSAVPIVSLGLLGTFATAGLMLLAAHYVLGFDWKTAALLGAAVAPTDPAVMFSVLGRKEVRGRSGTILEGESGANDPVGIALMLAVVGIAQTPPKSAASAAVDFVLELGVGITVGVLGALLIVQFLRRVQLRDAALYPLRTLAFAGVIYGLASILHGSGFLAVYIAGILIGDVDVPERGRILRFHTSIASLAEVAVFVALGLTVHIAPFGDGKIWMQGAVLFALLAFIARPLSVGPLLLPTRLNTGERVFVMWGGLKGAVPILLASFAVLGGVPKATRIYGIVFVVVTLSVLLQGTSIPWVAARLRVPMRTVDD
jgi:potassium/hydrogen antiporter